MTVSEFKILECRRQKAEDKRAEDKSQKTEVIRIVNDG
jgi:hypothetical protein